MWAAGVVLFTITSPGEVRSSRHCKRRTKLHLSQHFQGNTSRMANMLTVKPLVSLLASIFRCCDLCLCAPSMTQTVVTQIVVKRR
ncbi:hypothetical protein TIFTF001_038990 [Ficus carica]|uniref:Uncharacterized protein n=1 Tax=Ficus carica TaxID=3494 RepID=A0AA88E911_FICCA|nr:hypothetical protein TIFTF001_038990 [Ficus carica]